MKHAVIAKKVAGNGAEKYFETGTAGESGQFLTEEEYTREELDAFDFIGNEVLLSGGGALIPRVTELASQVFCRKAKVALTGGTFFGEEGEGFMRVNFACPRSQLKEGIKRLGAALEDK